MRKFECLLFVLKRSDICYYIICMTVPLKIVLWTISGLKSKYKGDKCDSTVMYLEKT